MEYNQQARRKMKNKVEQELAPNSTEGGYGVGYEGADAGKLRSQMLPDTRIHDYPNHHRYADTEQEMKGKRKKGMK